MKNGDIVTFAIEPDENTPGRPDSPYACTGVVVKDNYPNCGLTLGEGYRWCDVLWSNNQVTKCYKLDLEVWAYDR